MREEGWTLGSMERAGTINNQPEGQADSCPKTAWRPEWPGHSSHKEQLYDKCKEW